MDLVYMPEVLTYGAFRAPVYRDYEQPWNQDYFNYGKSSSIYCTRQMPKLSEQSKHNCHLCKKSKRRSLGSYIRGKSSRLNSCSEISEAEEADEEGEEEEAEEEEREGEESSAVDRKSPGRNVAKREHDAATIGKMKK